VKRLLCLTVALSFATLSAHATTIEMKVYGMVCGFCAQGIEASLRKNPAVVDVVVSLENKLVIVETRGSEDIDDAALKKAIADAGYDLKTVARTDRSMADHRAAIERTAK
jgi:copper chaperone CopZ